MIEQGKKKIMHLKQLGTISAQVMDQLTDIITPVDERRDYKEFELNKLMKETAERKANRRLNPLELLNMRKAKNREIKHTRFM